MDAATAGVIATGTIGLAGILATFFSPTWNERKREIREIKRRFRMAERLVEDELGKIAGTFEALKQGRSVATESLEVGVNFREWDAHKQGLADSLPDDVWQLVSDTYKELSATRALLEVAASSANRDLGDNLIGYLETDIGRCEKAVEVLRKAEPVLD